ncbi:hypothetical protein FAES_1476 [Fibrella aestuarina BUZ 2]|uniref:Uncharacterized protein n=1 Tax=Fibrella aestuarina BUZ 2 TaxID=1166018 RepID=I0K5T3_9BACT|nr:hypothetical protein FAES_1476 [Fibrella aestuarina BUZ 2]
MLKKAIVTPIAQKGGVRSQATSSSRLKLIDHSI